MIDKAVRAGLLLSVVALMSGCPEERPTREACRQACDRTAELQHQVHMKARLMAADDPDPAQLEAKIQTAWKQARAGKVGKQIEDCAIQCEAAGTKAQVECVMQAETVGAIRACRKLDASR